ncbi:twin-arginine translocase TatA/TatE family subunit [Bartonella sp. W8125]|uniref:twin-arginine translocase TatA/TatE family subunit n=1 Tax=Bartonella TaxID=773 RepID=UPI0018DCEEBD|nr:twin-arginine translocase TatA/TatE family subunit [Bartonella choladocola]MBI0140381.1 twin-arginine translocase TatA/TatE family subunit [Bartonella choladocola]
MGNFFSPVHLIVILLIILVLFGRGKISEFMGDFAKGIKSFKKGLKEDDEVETQQPAERPEIKTIDVQPEETVQPAKRVASTRKPAAAKTASRSTKSKAKTTQRKTTKS